MYGIRWSTTTPYNPCGNSQCKWFNGTLFGLRWSLDQEQKPNWPVYLPSLVFMFGHKAPMPCDNWLGLRHYKTGGFRSKTAWLG